MARTAMSAWWPSPTCRSTVSSAPGAGRAGACCGAGCRRRRAPRNSRRRLAHSPGPARLPPRGPSDDNPRSPSTPGASVQINGFFDLRFEAVRDAFATLFDHPGERGAALCVQIAGETVVDLWAGPADRDGQEMWQQDTLLNLFSCTKTFAAVATLQLVGEGKLELDAPVARYWPEFAAAGKEGVTVRHL